MAATPGNALDVTSAGIVTFDGTATFSGTTVTQHDVLVGGSSNGITSVAPSSTSGVPLVSQGASSDPSFGTAVVSGGGTGLTSVTAHYLPIGAGTSALTLLAPSATSGTALVSQGSSSDPAYGTVVVSSGGTGATSFTAYSVICGGTGSTSALQNVSGVGSIGQVLTSNGASALPTWQASASGGFTYNVVTTDQSMAVGNAYINNDTSSHTFTLPSTASVGQRVACGRYNTGGVVVAQSSGQTVRFGNLISTSGTGGSITSSAQGDWIEIVCVVANSGWMVDGQAQGSWTVV